MLLTLDASNKFLASTKAFLNYEKDDLDYDSFLRKKNLLDFGHFESDFNFIYNPDQRTIKYLKAEHPDLPYPFVLTGHGQITRPSCGIFLGLKATKKSTELTHKLMFTSCNQLQCPVCAEKSCSIKAKAIVQKFRDYIWYLITRGFSDYELRPKHYALNPNFVDKNGFEHINFVPDYSDNGKNYRKSLMAFVKKYIDPYMDASTWCYHEYRFADDEQTKLKNSGHFHVVGWGHFPHFKVFESMFGFQYVNIGYKNGTVISSLADLFRIWRYELSHVVFPRNKIIRTTKRTFDEISRMSRENLDNRLLGISEVQITEFRKDISLHSAPAYFYQGFMSSYLTRKIKERKILLPERSDLNNQKMYKILDGYLIREHTNVGTLIHTPAEAFDKRIKINLHLQIKYFKSKLKFSNRACREKHFFRIIKRVRE